MNNDTKGQEVAARVAKFVQEHDSATFCTSSVRLGGCPFGSLVPYAVSGQGSLIVHLALISEHYKNVVADSRASIFVSETIEGRDPQSLSRVCLSGTAVEMSVDESAELVEGSNSPQQLSQIYWARFPNARSKSIAHTFRFFELKVEAIRWIAGFGSIHWVQPSDYSRAICENKS